MKYIATRANAFGRLNLKPHVKHIAGTGNWTLCGRRLSDPWQVASDSEHTLCAKCKQSAGI